MPSSFQNKIELSSGPLLDKVCRIAKAANEQGGRALLVGGYVRDTLLGLHPKDADLEVYGIEAPQLRDLLSRFGRVNCVGESFRVYKLAWHKDGERFELDISLPRHDKKVGAGHKGFEVEGDPHASFEDAARRRDFTLNAILCDALTGEVIDPFHGRADLENKTLRVVDPVHFAEDSLRVLRAMQFAARFGLTIDPATVAICQDIELADLPGERLWGEWEKMLLKAERPSVGLRSAQELGILAKLFPYLETAMAREGETMCAVLDAAHAEWETWPIDEAVQPDTVPAALHGRLALCLAAIGSFLGDDAATFLDALKVHTWQGYNARESILALVRERDSAVALWQRFAGGDTPADGELRRLAGRCNPRLLFHFTRARGHAAAAEWFLQNLQRLNIEHGPPAPFLMGRHLLELGLKPGPQIGQITRAVFELQLDGDVRTLEEALAAGQKLMNENS